MVKSDVFLRLFVSVAAFVCYTSATYCRTRLPDSRVHVTYCPETCCHDYVYKRTEVCCSSDVNMTSDLYVGVAVGAAVGGLMVSGLACLCIVSVCCRRAARGRMEEAMPEAMPEAPPSTQVLTIDTRLTRQQAPPPQYDELAMLPPPYKEACLQAAGVHHGLSSDGGYCNAAFADPPPKYTCGQLESTHV